MNVLLYKMMFRLQQDLEGQDLVEYALIAGCVAVAGGAIFPTTIAPQISSIFSKLTDYFGQAATLGS